MNISKRTKYISRIGVMTAIAVLLMFWEIPILPSFPYLKLDFSDVPALIGGLTMGPVAAIIIQLLKNVIHFIIKNDGTGGIGNLANFIVGIGLCLPAAWYYAKHKSTKGLVIGLTIGIVCMIITGVIFNYFVLLPLYGMTEHDIKMPIIYGGIIPINAIKSVCACILTGILYKPLSAILHQ